MFLFDFNFMVKQLPECRAAEIEYHMPVPGGVPVNRKRPKKCSFYAAMNYIFIYTT